MGESISKARLKVVGRVQGVFYRVSTREKGQALGLRGWVRNRLDGSVEVLALGNKAELEKLVEWCTEGPSGARVDRVETEWLEPQSSSSKEDKKSGEESMPDCPGEGFVIEDTV